MIFDFEFGDFRLLTTQICRTVNLGISTFWCKKRVMAPIGQKRVGDLEESHVARRI